jgi:hypothetical protein
MACRDVATASQGQRDVYGKNQTNAYLDPSNLTSVLASKSREGVETFSTRRSNFLNGLGFHVDQDKSILHLGRFRLGMVFPDTDQEVRRSRMNIKVCVAIDIGFYAFD